MTAVESLVVDVAIVGARLGGLALARVLHAHDVSVVVIEAREGGRADAMLRSHRRDAGPRSGWFWPDAEPPITALLDELELGMPSVRQHDPGDARWLSTLTANRSGARGRLGRMPGARHIAGGTARLVDTQAAALLAACVRTGSALLMLRDRGA